MKNKLYYHISLSDDYGSWSSIFMEHFKLMEDHYLTDTLDEINIGCVYNLDNTKESFDSLAKCLFKNPNIVYYENSIKSDDTADYLEKLNSSSSVTENVTLKKIYDDCQKEDFNILYLHSKGVTGIARCLKLNLAHDYVRYFYWRQYLNWAVIENWKICLDAINKGYDLASTNFMTSPVSHISGNMWWSKASYIRTLPDPSEIDWFSQMRELSDDYGFKYRAIFRHRDEMWITSKNRFKFYHIDIIEEKDNPAYKFLPRREYVRT